MGRIVVFLLLTSLWSPHNHAQYHKPPITNLENFDKQRVHWGYFLGFNSYDFKFDYIEDQGDVLVDRNIGFNVGLIGDLRLFEYMNLRLEPGLYFTTRNLSFPDPSLITETQSQREVKSTYIHLPLLLKISSKRLDNVRPYVVAGVSTSINLASNEDSVEDNLNGTFRMKTNTYYYELGVGVDFYLPYFKFSPSIRGVFALNDELVRDNDPNSPWTSNIDQMQTRGIFVNLAFE